MAEPYGLLEKAIKHNKFMRFALAVVGLGAAVAIIATFQITPEVAVFGGLIVFAMMICLLLFSYLARAGPQRHAALASFMAWSFLAMAVTASALFLSSYFFRWPRDLQAEPPPVSRLLASLETGWIFAGYFDFDSNIWPQGRYVHVAIPIRGELPGGLPREGDVVEVDRQERNVLIKDYRTQGFKRQMECIVLAKPSPEDTATIKDVDITRVKLPIGYRVAVRQVCKGNIPDKPVQAVWLRVADDV